MQHKPRRQRGVVITPNGLRKLQGEIGKFEENQKERNSRCNQEELCAHIKRVNPRYTITPMTLGKLLKRQSVEKGTLEKVFAAFNLEPEDGDWGYPERDDQRQEDIIVPKRQYWGEAIDVSDFYGRVKELDTLNQWLLEHRCRLVALVGTGGIGKTSIAAKLAKQIYKQFEYVYWQSLLDAPSIEATLIKLIQFLSDEQETDLPESLGERVSLLIEYLRSKRCLLILDNVESIMRGGSRAGQYLDGYEGYDRLLRAVGEAPHQSCLLLTSREKPREIASQEGEESLVRSLKVSGLKDMEGQQVLKQKGLSGSKSEFKRLVERYVGNALALKLVATHIQEVFDGEIECFLEHGTTFFGDIQELLEQQFERLTSFEKQVMFWLAINREPVSFPELLEDIVPQPRLRQKLQESLNSLVRRSLLEKRSAELFTLQPVVIEFVTEQLIKQVCEEIISQNVNLFRYHTLIKATAKDYIRDAQVRLILKPVIDELLTVFSNEKGIKNQLDRILTTLQVTSPLELGYAAGNILNLLAHLKIDFNGYNFSKLTVWQADLRNVKLHDVNFQNADLAKSVFAEAFGGVLSVAFSPNGKLLAMGDTNGEIRLYQIADGKQVLTCHTHTNWVVSLAFSPDSNKLASGSSDCTVRLWDVSTGRCLHILGEHKHEVWSVVFSPDGETLASGSDDQTARLWCVSTGKCLRIFQGHTNYVLSVAFSPDGQKLLSGSHDRTIRLWCIITGECSTVFQGHDDGIRSIAVSPDGQKLASSSNDKTVRLWNLSTGKCLRIFQGHSNQIFSVAFSPQDNTIASGSHDQTVRLWDVNSGECLKILQGHSNLVFSVAFSPQGNIIASGSRDQTMKLWDVNTGKCLKTFHGYTNQILSVAFSPNGQTLASGGHDRTVKCWDVSNGQALSSLRGHTNWVYSLAFSPQGDALVSCSGDKTLKLWDMGTGQCLKTFHGHQAAILSVAFSPDGQILASGSEDQTVRLWDVRTGQCLRIFHGHQAAIWSVAFSSQGGVLASGALDQKIKLWDVRSEECLRTLEGHTSWVWAVACSPRGDILASTSPDRTLRLWSISTGECLRLLPMDTCWFLSVAFSPDSRTLASSTQDHTIKLWDVSTGECLRTLEGHTAWIWSVAFSPDNQTLASSGEDQTIRFWDVRTGECLKIIRAEKPYEQMNIMGVTGLTEATVSTLKALGAVERPSFS